MNVEYISREIIRKDGRSGGSPRKHPKNGYAKYEISVSNSDTPLTDWVKVDSKLNDISVDDDGTVWGAGLNKEKSIAGMLMIVPGRRFPASRHKICPLFNYHIVLTVEMCGE